MARAFIVWSSNGQLHASEVQESGETVLGRSSTAQVVIEDDTVSRSHARVRPEGDAYVIENLSGVNPTKVNRAAVSAPQPLSDGDRLELGNVQLAFHDLASSENVASLTCSNSACSRTNDVNAYECWYCGTSLVNAPTVIIEKKTAACRLIPETGDNIDLFPGQAILLSSQGPAQLLRSDETESYGSAAVVIRNGVPFIVPSASDETPRLNGEPLADGRSLRTGDAIELVGRRHVVVVR